MLNILATAISADPKAAAADASAPNAFFEPFPSLPWLTAGFFILSCIMIWFMIRAGKGSDYNS